MALVQHCLVLVWHRLVLPPLPTGPVSRFLSPLVFVGEGDDRYDIAEAWAPYSTHFCRQLDELGHGGTPLRTEDKKHSVELVRSDSHRDEGKEAVQKVVANPRRRRNVRGVPPTDMKVAEAVAWHAATVIAQ